MKKLFVSVLFVAVTFAAFTSCNKDDDYVDGVGIEFRMRNEDYGDDEVYLFTIDSLYRSYVGGTGFNDYDYIIWYPDLFYLKISKSNNFYLVGERERQNNGGGIACVGNVRGLGQIKTIPTSGWAGEVAVQPGKGYIARGTNGLCSHGPNSEKYHYARIYVKDWIESTDGGIIGAIIKYQSEWKVE